MVRWLPVVLLALVLTAPSLHAMADEDEDLQKLTQQIEAGTLKGSALADAYRERGTRRLVAKDVPGALADYDRAVAAAPGRADAYVDRSFGRKEAGDPQHAIDDLSQALTLGLADPAAGFYLRAELRAIMKDFPGALADYDQAIALDRGFGHAYIGRGTARMETDDNAGALADLNHAINGKGDLYHYKDPFRVAPHLGAIITKEFGKRGMEIGSSSEVPVTAYLARGRALLQKGDYERARPDFQYVVGQGYKKPELWLYYSLDLLAIHHCWDGEDMLDKAAETMGTTREALVQAHRDFIAKTPCAEDLLQ